MKIPTVGRDVKTTNKMSKKGGNKTRATLHKWQRTKEENNDIITDKNENKTLMLQVDFFGTTPLWT